MEPIITRCRLTAIATFLTSFGLAAGASAATPTPAPTPTPGLGGTFYVSPAGNNSNPGTLSQPFLTIDYARQMVRNINSNMSGDIVVYLRGGTYTLSSTITFDALDSGTNNQNVIYKAYPGERPILSGGQTITNWTAVPATSLYQASVSPASRFRQLYVNKVRAVRARKPNVGSYYFITSWDGTNKKLLIPSAQISNWQHLTEVEMSIQIYGGVDAKLRIASFASAGGGAASVTPMEPERTHVFAQSPYPPHNPNRPYYFDNAYEFLDAPGEWYLNTATNILYYWPRAGEDMATADVAAPVLENLVNVQGTLNNNAHHIQFYGLIFMNSSWEEPSFQGYLEDQACIVFAQDVPLPADQMISYPGHRMPAGFVIDSANNIVLERNVFEHMGGSAINLYQAASYNTILGNVITDVSGSGICVDLNLEGNPDGLLDTRKLSPHNTIKNNYIKSIGIDYLGASGIFVGYTDGSVIDHNELFHGPQHGIDVGWGWDNRANAMRNNRVTNNKIHDYETLLSDGAGIYTLSLQPGTLIDSNYVYDIVHTAFGGYANNGIFFDNGTSEVTASNNVFANIPDGNIRFNPNPVPADTAHIYLSNNISNDGSPGAAAIIDNSGVEPAYEDILAFVDATPIPGPPTPTPGSTSTPIPGPTPTPTLSPTPTQTPTPTPASSQITASPDSVTFTAVAGGAAPAPQSIQVSTSNGASWNSFDTSPWFNCGPTGGASGTSTILNPDTRGLSVGTYSQSITFSAAGLPSKAVVVTLILTGPPTPTPTATPVQTPTATPAPTPTPPGVSISGIVSSCPDPSSGPVPGVTLTLTGDATSSTISDGSGNYTFTGLSPGGTYTVTPTKSALPPGSSGITLADVIAVQEHALNLAPLTGCQMTAADVNNDTLINLVDVLAIHRFALGFTDAIASTGEYQFTPANRTYPAVVADQTDQDYDTLVSGDIVSPFATRASGPSQPASSTSAIPAKRSNSR